MHTSTFRVGDSVGDREVQVIPSATSETPAYQQHRQLLTEHASVVAEAEESLLIHTDWYDLPNGTGELLCAAHVLLSKVGRLGSLHLEGPLDATILQILPSLGHLTRLKVGAPCSIDDIQQLCSVPTLDHLECW